LSSTRVKRLEIILMRLRKSNPLWLVFGLAVRLTGIANVARMISPAYMSLLPCKMR